MEGAGDFDGDGGRKGLMLQGRVVHGDGRGRVLDYPTANVEILEGRQPLDEGVFAGLVERADGSRYLAAVSIGTRPTYHEPGAACVIEAFLLDFEGDLYGEQVRLHLLDKVRDQVRFESGEELIAAMARDVEAVRRICRGTSAGSR